LARRGPNTEAGKAAVRLNPVTHGVLSTTPVIPGLEHQEDWEAHISGVVESLAPQGRLETTLTVRAGLLLWRLMRLARYETEMIAADLERAEIDFARRHPPTAPSTESNDMARSSLRTYQEALSLLERLPSLSDDTSVEGEVVAAALSCVLDCTEAGLNLEIRNIPGVPEDLYWEEFDGWTGNLVRQAISVIADCAGSPPESLLEGAIEQARSDVQSAEVYLRLAEQRAEENARAAEEQARQVAADLDRLRRECLLPNDSVLQKVIRYEAHLNRQLYQALHELEALQSRRRGEPTPLARVDVQGLPEK
jgi:hypothetical protein